MMYPFAGSGCQVSRIAVRLRWKGGAVDAETDWFISLPV